MHKRGLFGMNGFMVFLLTGFSFAAHAQQPGYLILIDAENKQAFTVRIGRELYASSGHGHLVLANLKDSSYRLNLRFPKNTLAEQVFPVMIHGKDLGFQLKGADSIWILYNWQTRETIHPVKEMDSSRILDQGIKREDGFSKLMAAVVNDSSVMYNTYTGTGLSGDSSVQSLKLKAESLKLKAESLRPKAESKGDSLITANSQLPTLPGSRTTAIGQQPTANRQPSTINRQPSTTTPIPQIKKLREISLKISRKIVFLDIGKDGQADTVTLFIYFETQDLAGKQNPPVSDLKKPAGPDSAAVIAAQVKNKTVVQAGEPGCGSVASEADLEWLRSAILKANAEQDKIAIASAGFAQKCFSVSQIRVLAGLFVSDKARYNLMDAAHLHVADYEHFPELADMYTDKNFQRKFMKMAVKRT